MSAHGWVSAAAAGGSMTSRDVRPCSVSMKLACCVISAYVTWSRQYLRGHRQTATVDCCRPLLLTCWCGPFIMVCVCVCAVLSLGDVSSAPSQLTNALLALEIKTQKAEPRRVDGESALQVHVLRHWQCLDDKSRVVSHWQTVLWTVCLL